ncbi:uncharacterized protein BcabD6B2_17080 [Babesia caballi]|uniref:Uncharacterized protein n=1 Tax=Babesia caballi TaxID=5871 RepID=A0AAV4LQL3_BABCB|nr:hypothetical protein BcabD6B2_17080 [Babesia caballi]
MTPTRSSLERLWPIRRCCGRDAPTSREQQHCGKIAPGKTPKGLRQSEGQATGENAPEKRHKRRQGRPRAASKRRCSPAQPRREARRANRRDRAPLSRRATAEQWPFQRRRESAQSERRAFKRTFSATSREKVRTSTSAFSMRLKSSSPSNLEYAAAAASTG